MEQTKANMIKLFQAMADNRFACAKATDKEKDLYHNQVGQWMGFEYVIEILKDTKDFEESVKIYLEEV